MFIFFKFFTKGEEECPIYEELDEVFKSGIHPVLLIDDAKCFNGENDFPTIENLSKYVLARHNKAS